MATNGDDRLRRIADGVFVIPNYLDSERCTQLIAIAEAIGFDAAGVGNSQRRIDAIRNNDRVIVQSPLWAADIELELMRHRLPVLDDQSARGFTEFWRFYRYTPGQRFKMHKDGYAQERGMRSRLTFMIYLNDEFRGGETRFRSSEWDAKNGFDVVAETGKALLFRHELWHEGAPLVEGVKYALRGDILYA